MAAKMGVIEGRHVVSVLSLFVGQKRARRINRRRSQTQRLKLFKKLLGLVVESARFDQTIDQLSERKPVLHIL